MWARHCPENFENRPLLVAAEIARIEGRDPDAMRLYEQAIRSARENGFVNNEALALEIAARFYADVVSTGSPRPTCETLGTATGSGAPTVKSGSSRRSIPISPDEQSGVRSDADSARRRSNTSTSSTVLKLSQAVQGETDLEKLIAAVMRLGLEHAGAERGLLISSAWRRLSDRGRSQEQSMKG